jgi:transcriptional regulator of nitric oxide reductase
MKLGGRVWRLAAFLALFCVWGLLGPCPTDAHLSEDLAKAVAPPGYDLGPVQPGSFAYPLIKAGRVEGYVFDTLDYAPIPGFSGTPIDMIVSLNNQGMIMDVHLISQNEPVFVDGLGVDPFLEFLTQYRGKYIRQNISVGSVYGNRSGDSSGGVALDGITKASASVRIANVTILSSAISVARSHLAGAAPPSGATVRKDVFESLDWDQLLKRGLVQRITLDNETVQKAFAGTVTVDDDPDAKADPQGLFTDLYFTEADIPSVGVALFGQEGYDRLMAHLDPGDHALAVFSNGRWSFLEDNFVRGSQPQRLKIEQAGFAIGGRDLPVGIDLSSRVPAMQTVAILRIPGSAGLDPSAPWTLSVSVNREHGIIYPEVVTRTFGQKIEFPADYFTKPEARSNTDWLLAWEDQWRQVTALCVLLAILTTALIYQKRATANKRWFRLGRLAFLAVTLVWVGWIAQGQLSIVTVLGLVKAVFHGSDMGFMLYDPVSLILWAYTIVSLAVWGRGSFCGWLCPFGALQEFVATLARLLRIPQRRVGLKTAKAAIWIKYVILAVLVAGTIYNAALAEILAEAEPFKTAITLGFRREVAFVLYAVGLLIWGLVVYKPFCRFLCPLGAGLALAGRARRWNWIPRRSECGTPCRLCEKRCEYGAIAPSGAIDYTECFQCLDCVAIYHDRKTCVPLILEDRRAQKAEQRISP